MGHFPAQLPKHTKKKPQKNPPRKKFLTFPGMKLSSPNIKKILLSSQKKTFLIFSQKKCFSCISRKSMPGNLLILQERKPRQISYISRNENAKKPSHISGNGTVQSTPKRFRILQEAKTQKKFLHFSQNKAIFLPK